MEGLKQRMHQRSTKSKTLVSSPSTTGKRKQRQPHEESEGWMLQAMDTCALFAGAQVGRLLSKQVPSKAADAIKEVQPDATRSNSKGSAQPKAAKRATSSSSPTGKASTPRKEGVRDKLRSLLDEGIGLLVITCLINLPCTPHLIILALFVTATNLSFTDAAVYSGITSGVLSLMVMSRSITTHLYLKDSSNGLRKDVSPNAVKYMLPQVAAMSIPAVATYRHYLDDMGVFIPVFLLTIFEYIYQFTYHGRPQQTGCRQRESWINGRSFVIDTVEQYFSGKIIRTVPLDPKKQYVMAFHPHGILPISVMWIQFTEQWRRLFPGFHAHILTASVLHQLPFVRDILQFFGGREVTRQTIKSTLEEKGSVMLVPGGQAEMLHQQSGHKEVRVYTHHKGFIRLAIESGVPLVPVLSFNEGEMMDNVQAPGLQRWFVKNMAFPFPYYPYGRGFMSIPRKVHIPIVVGEPMEVPHILKPSREEVERVHGEYFEKLEELFLKSKEAAGCGDYKLVLI